MIDLNFEEALTAELEAITGLTDRVFPLNATEGLEPPFIVYISNNGEEIMDLGGFSGMYELNAEIHVVAEDYEELKSLEKQVLDKVKSFWGRSIGDGGPLIKSITLTEPIESHENELGYDRVIFDMRVRFNAS